MREKVVRFCLVVLIAALAGMYGPAMQTPYSGWLPPATPEEAQAYGVFAHHGAQASAQPKTFRNPTFADGVAHLHLGDADAESTPHGYTTCDSPVASEPADFKSDF